MSYFSKYVQKLQELKDIITSDIESAEDDTIATNLRSFKNEITRTIHIASNNSFNENKGSLMTGADTSWPEYDPDTKSNAKR